MQNILPGVRRCGRFEGCDGATGGGGVQAADGIHGTASANLAAAAVLPTWQARFAASGKKDSGAGLFRCGCGSQNRFGIPFWLVGEFTTHFRAYFSGDWDVRWGYGILTHGHVFMCSVKIFLWGRDSGIHWGICSIDLFG